VPASSIVLAENGSVVELSASGVRLADRVDSGVMFVDGLAVGDISDVALRDRRRLSEDGVVIVVATLSSSNGRPTATPELIARGFAEADELLEELRSQAGSVLEDLLAQGILEIKLLQQHLHDDLGQLVYDRTRRRPLILPVVVEV
jgi:ribonuclease J